MKSDADCLVLLHGIRTCLKTDESALQWVRDVVDREQATEDELQTTKQLLITLQEEHQKALHNLNLTEKMVSKLSTWMTQNCPEHAVYDALEPTRDEREAALWKKLELDNK
jgi:DNA-binding transcriptional regulator GbsR (MarR family)